MIIITIIPSILYCCISIIWMVIFYNTLNSLFHEINSSFLHPSIFSITVDIIMAILSLVMIIYFPFSIIYWIANILYSKLQIDAKGIMIKSLDTKLFIEWDKIIGRKEELFLSIQKRQYLLLSEQVKLYNRGIYYPIMFWSKTNTIYYSHYEDTAIAAINEKVKMI
jgi:hypothetical protein